MIIVTSHPHLYGIDLASTAELIAHGRTAPEIAAAIGADRVIYQTLPDLEAACREALPPSPDGSAPPAPRFEVGVFTGAYATPIDDGYLEHLERLRGARRRTTLEQRARHAVVNGVAREEDLRILAGGRDEWERLRGREGKGRLVASEEAVMNGVSDGVRVGGPGESQDISLHNLRDQV